MHDAQPSNRCLLAQDHVFAFRLERAEPDGGGGGSSGAGGGGGGAADSAAAEMEAVESQCF